jgi:glutamate-1-semialdehyde 2,1-aminomutase
VHALTGLLGPARAVQSLQATTMPQRIVRCRADSGATVQVSSPDVVLLQLEFGEGTLAQVMSSFAVTATRAPLMEIHAERGTIVVAEQPPLTDHGPVDVYLRDVEHGLEGWLPRVSVRPPRPVPNSLIAAGLVHFVACLRGDEEPVLSAEHALHVLDVLRTAEESSASGRRLSVRSTFGIDDARRDTPDAEPAGRTGSQSRSAELLARAQRVIPGGVNSGRRTGASKLCLREALGAQLTDVDGNRYVDYHAAYGPIILGHAHPLVNARVTAAIRRGALYGIGVSPDEERLAERIVEHVPSIDQVLLCNSGSEATYHALRLARAATGRELLLRFDGTYHGWHDAVRQSAGGLRTTRERTLTCRFNDLAHVERTVRAHPGAIAAIIAEPFVHNAAGGSIAPVPGFLNGLRALCDREGIVLIFDEVVTGFRHHLGGFQAIAGVTPDLTTLAKAIANGFPVAAVGGRRDLMELFTTHPQGSVVVGGTYNGNQTVVAAALATLDVMEQEPVHEHIYALGQRMRAGLEEIVVRAGVSAQVTGHGSLFALGFFDGPVRDHRDVARNDTDLFLAYRGELVARGVFEIPENVGRSHISYSHTAGDIDFSLEVAEQALHAAVQRRGRRASRS